MRTDRRFQHLLHPMQPQMVDRIFAAMPQIESHHGVEPAPGLYRCIGLFGGEPLLAANRPIIEHIMARARDIGTADFWAVTNGTELAAYRDLLGPDGLAHLQITLDGPAREHDQRRVYADGSGSFDRIAEHITLALEQRARVSIRLNIDRNNLDNTAGSGS